MRPLIIPGGAAETPTARAAGDGAMPEPDATKSPTVHPAAPALDARPEVPVSELPPPVLSLPELPLPMVSLPDLPLSVVGRLVVGRLVVGPLVVGRPVATPPTGSPAVGPPDVGPPPPSRKTAPSAGRVRVVLDPPVVGNPLPRVVWPPAVAAAVAGAVGAAGTVGVAGAVGVANGWYLPGGVGRFDAALAVLCRCALTLAVAAVLLAAMGVVVGGGWRRVRGPIGRTGPATTELAGGGGR